jgi:hypothetical protein
VSGPDPFEVYAVRYATAARVDPTAVTRERPRAEHPGGGVFGAGRATAMRMFEDLRLDFERITG